MVIKTVLPIYSLPVYHLSFPRLRRNKQMENKITNNFKQHLIDRTLCIAVEIHNKKTFRLHKKNCTFSTDL